MKKFLVAILFSIVAAPTFAINMVIHDVTILRVIDGDTVVIAAPYLPDPLKKELSVRVWGVDTPEKGFRAKCRDEDIKAKASTAFTRQTVADSKQQQVAILGWDKYGGRVLGDVILDGRSLRDLLIKNDLGRPYYGDAKKSWCKESP